MASWLEQVDLPLRLMLSLILTLLLPLSLILSLDLKRQTEAGAEAGEGAGAGAGAGAETDGRSRGALAETYAIVGCSDHFRVALGSARRPRDCGSRPGFLFTKLVLFLIKDFLDIPAELIQEGDETRRKGHLCRYERKDLSGSRILILNPPRLKEFCPFISVAPGYSYSTTNATAAESSDIRTASNRPICSLNLSIETHRICKASAAEFFVSPFS